MNYEEIIDECFCRCADTPSTELTPELRCLVTVWHSMGLIQNGGFHSWICELEDEVEDALNDYELLELHQPASMIRGAYDLWKRSRILDPDVFRNEASEELDQLESEFYEFCETDEFLERLYLIAKTLE